MTSAQGSTAPYDEGETFRTLMLSLRHDAHEILSEKPALPNGLIISRRSRFVIPASGSAPIEARGVARTMLRLMLSGDEASEALVRRVETCMAEIVAVVYTLTEDDALLCSVWVDDEHAFLSVEHHHRLPQVADQTSLALSVVQTIADDFGTHFEDGVHQTWAAVRR
ncbi:hypothetical protein [Streptomyces microflavus]|uniref:hypothetical protein n=1 Tax=Streptomyces microflavus TaxID=1919 RepID=UPI0033D67FB6